LGGFDEEALQDRGHSRADTLLYTGPAGSQGLIERGGDLIQQPVRDSFEFSFVEAAAAESAASVGVRLVPLIWGRPIK
jgi:hypothetical protein